MEQVTKNTLSNQELINNVKDLDTSMAPSTGGLRNKALKLLLGASSLLPTSGQTLRAFAQEELLNPTVATSLETAGSRPVSTSQTEVATNSSPTAQNLVKKLTREMNVIPHPDSSAVIINDTYSVCYVNYKGSQIPIYHSKTNMTRFGSGVKPTGSQLKDLEFFVGLNLSIPYESLIEAYNNKKEVGKNRNGERIYEMTYVFDLLPEELKEKTAETINQLNPGASVGKTNIKLIPYSRIEGSMILDGNKKNIISYPNIEPDANINKEPVIGSPKTVEPVVINGTKEFLRKTTEEASFEITTHLGGFHIKQNFLTYSLKVIAQQMLDEKLKGEGNSSSSTEAFTSNLAVGGSLMEFLGFGGQRTDSGQKIFHQSLVTRDQVKEFVRRATSQMHVSGWSEFDSTSLRDEITRYLLDRMNTFPVAISDQGKLILDDAMRDHLKPDVITKIEDGINAHTDLKNENTKSLSLSSPASAAVEAGKNAAEKTKDADNKSSPGNSSLSSSQTNNFNYVNKDEIKYVQEGGRVVPKTIELFVCNLGVFEDYAQIKTSETIAIENGIELSQFSTVYEDYDDVRQQVETELTYDLHINQLDHLNGDTDIFSGEGRGTWHRLRVYNLKNHGDHLTLDVHAMVHEGVSDYTKFEKSMTIRIDAPEGMKILEAGKGQKPYGEGDPIHTWGVQLGTLVMSEERTNGTYVEFEHCKIDSYGDENRPDALMFKAKIRINVLLAPIEKSVRYIGRDR